MRAGGVHERILRCVVDGVMVVVGRGGDDEGGG